MSVIEDQKNAEEIIRSFNTVLEEKVAERTSELEEKKEQLSDIQKSLLNLVEDLNIQSDELADKTKNLELVNKELEAFSYSVSHDLRAPLRAINGFSKFLADDYEDELGMEGKRLIGIIRSNATKMDQLITDVLQLAKVARGVVSYVPLNMKDMVVSIFNALALPEEIESFSFKVMDIPECYADKTMMEQVWTNLISNALKYTAPAQHKNILVDYVILKIGLIDVFKFLFSLFHY